MSTHALKLVPQTGCSRRSQRVDQWSPHPPSTRCSICWNPLEPNGTVLEQRATGESGQWEPWPYCLGCWDGMLRLREVTRGFMAAGPAAAEFIQQGQSGRQPGDASIQPFTDGEDCNRLLAFVAGSLDLDSGLSFLLHLDDCVRCRRTMDKAYATNRVRRPWRPKYQPSVLPDNPNEAVLNQEPELEPELEFELELEFA